MLGEDSDGLSEFGFYHAGLGNGLFGDTWMKSSTGSEIDPQRNENWEKTSMRVSGKYKN